MKVIAWGNNMCCIYIQDEKQNLLPKIKQNVEDVQAILQENMERANDRYENLDELDERADKLLAYVRVIL